jgi:hypothetical protein
MIQKLKGKMTWIKNYLIYKLYKYISNIQKYLFKSITLDIDKKLYLLEEEDLSRLNLGGLVNPLHQELSELCYYVRFNYNSEISYNLLNSIKEDMNVLVCEIGIEDRYFDLVKFYVEFNLIKLKEVVEQNEDILLLYTLYKIKNDKIFIDKKYN